MKIRKYPELTALKGKIREEKKSYRKLSEKIGISLNNFSDKVNGYSVFDTDEVDNLVSELNIQHEEILRYFFPRMLRNATTNIQLDEESATKEAI